MNFRDFRQAGHWPTLLAAFLYFDVSFMVWVMLGPLSLYLSAELGLSVEEKFSLVATPILSGALLRIVLGTLADHIGPRRTGLLAQIVVIAALAWVWLFGLHSKTEVYALAIMLGIAGASFAVALPQASRWYPPKFQGIVMGIAGAGNVGVVLDSMIVPWLAEHYGWQSVFGFLLIPLLAVLVFYAWVVKDAPDRRAPVTFANYVVVLRDADTWWFMFFYAITFGGFVGLGSALPLYFTNWYHVSGVTAGMMAALVVFAGAMARPLGGWVADRFGGIRSLQILFVLVAASYLAIAGLPEGPLWTPATLDSATANTVTPSTAIVSGWTLANLPPVAWQAVAIFFFGVAALGMGNGAVFQLVPLRFRAEIGLMTGLVGAAGGIGGFFLARSLGWSRALTGEFSSGFWLFAGLALIGLGGLVSVKTRWRTTWGAVSGARV